MGYRSTTDEFVVYARTKLGNWFVSGEFSKTSSTIKSMVTVSRPDSKYYYLKDRTRNITQDHFYHTILCSILYQWIKNLKKGSNVWWRDFYEINEHKSFCENTDFYPSWIKFSLFKRNEIQWDQQNLLGPGWMRKWYSSLQW